MIQLYDSLTREKRPFEPIEPDAVSMYVCGPTVYDDCHVGHLMGPVLFDAVARWLRARGYRVRFVNNITDIDDKIINRAAETGEDWLMIAERYTQQYFQLLDALAVETITDHPRCTAYIPAMIAFIEGLIAEDRAYVAGDGVYYDVGRQQGYGKLSGRRLDEMVAGSRIERDAGLRHPADFALWKLAKDGEPSWDSPWGAGRPGWHLECSVMAGELLGDEFDIHGGGDDLKFPHHENEIAQSEAHGCRFAHAWMHNGLAQYGGSKIAKSDPRMADPAFARQFKAGWLVDTYGAPALRFFLLQGHYRRPFDFEPENVAAARTALLRLHKQLGDLLASAAAPTLADLQARELPADLAARRDAFCAAMDDDFHTGKAISELFALANAARGAADPQPALELVRDLGRLIGLFRPQDVAAMGTGEVPAADATLESVLRILIELRQAARANRDFQTADRIRDHLLEVGIELKDGPDGTTWERR